MSINKLIIISKFTIFFLKSSQDKVLLNMMYLWNSNADYDINFLSNSWLLSRIVNIELTLILLIRLGME